MLRAKLPGYILRELGKALLRYAEESPEGFAHLFDPTVPSLPVRDDRPELTRLMRVCGVVSGDAQMVSRHRIRRRGDHLYLMELGDVEYFQDLWPETDELLDALEGLPPGRLLDLGTGCGIVGLEAAARGHQVVATDLDPQAVALARVNAHLNGIEGVDFREGDLFAPVAGEAFDAILTAPHYGRAYNQLRVSVLRDGPQFIAPNGKLLLATVLEWSRPGELPMVKQLDQRLPPEIAIRVRPIERELKSNWFWSADAESPAIISEHRFLIELARQSSPSSPRVVEVAWPSAPNRVDFVPLSRLLVPGHDVPGRAVVESPADVARLRALVASFVERELRFEGGLPRRMLDSCRFGKARCVEKHGSAAGAILDADGGVRPCSHGAPVGSFDDSFASLSEKYDAAMAALTERRGCVTCPAEWLCSRCMNTTPFTEPEYCDFMRTNLRVLPFLHRLLALGQQLGDLGVAHGPMRIFRSPWGMPKPDSEEVEMGQTSRRELDVLRERWNHEETWTIAVGDRAFLSFYRDAEFQCIEVEPVVAIVGEQVADGATATDLHRVAKERQLPASYVERARRKLASHLGVASTKAGA